MGTIVHVLQRVLLRFQEILSFRSKTPTSKQERHKHHAVMTQHFSRVATAIFGRCHTRCCQKRTFIEAKKKTSDRKAANGAPQSQKLRVGELLLLFILFDWTLVNSREVRVDRQYGSLPQGSSPYVSFSVAFPRLCLFAWVLICFFVARYCVSHLALFEC